MCVSLVTNGEQSEEGEVGVHKRSEALSVLCDMCPSQALVVRRMCVSTAFHVHTNLTITLLLGARSADQLTM